MSTIRPKKPAVSPGGVAGGDLHGEYPNPEVYGLEGYPMETPPPSNGDTITFNAVLQRWEHNPPVSTGGYPIGPAGGDLSGSYPDPTVAKILGRTLSSSAPATGNSLVWNGTQWAPATPGATGSAGGDLTGTYPNPTLVAVGSAATYGSASQVAVITTDSKGRVSSASNTSIQIAESQVTDLTTHLGNKADKTTTVSAGTGLSGGGDLSANRTISMPNIGTAGVYGSSTSIPVITTDAQGRVSGVTPTAISTTLSSAAFPRLGKTLVVDSVNGVDATAAVNGLPFLTIEGAISYINTNSLSGVTIWVAPGTYALSAGITIPATCALRGSNTQTTLITLSASNPGGTVYMVTMGENTRIEDINLTITSSNATTNLVGIRTPGTTSNTSKFRTGVLTVNNSGLASGTTTNVYGILDDGTGTPGPSSFSFNFTRGVTVNIYSNGGGSKRGVFVSGANDITFRDTNIYVAAPTSSASVGSYCGVETANALSSAQFRTSSIYGPTSAGSYTGSDILQTTPGTGNIEYGIQLGPGCDLISKTAGGKPFTTYVTPTTLIYGVNAQLLAAPRYLWPGVMSTGGDNTEIFYRFQQKTIVQGISVNMRIAPGAGHTATFTVYKSTTGVAGSGVATVMQAIVSDTNKTASNYTVSVDFAQGEYLALRADRTAAGAEDIVVEIDVF